MISVSGAGGFIGGHLVARLLADGEQVRAVDIKPVDEWWQVHGEADNRVVDLRDVSSADEAVAGADWVYDLAEDMGGVGWLVNNRADGLASFRILLNVAEASVRAGVERLWFASSACAYNTDLQLVPDVISLKETDAFPAKPERGYGEAKWMGERLCAYYQAEGRLETRLARYHNVYGSHGTYEGGREKAPAAICRKVAEAVLTGDHRIDIWGDGHQSRSFMYVADCVEGTLRIMNSDFHDPLNLGSHEMVTINQLVDIVSDIAGVTLEKHHDLSAPQGVRGRNSDNTLIQQELGWEPSIPLRDGLEKTYAWIWSQLNN